MKGKAVIDENQKANLYIKNWIGNIKQNDNSFVSINLMRCYPMNFIEGDLNCGDLDGDIEIYKNAHVNIYISGKWCLDKKITS